MPLPCVLWLRLKLLAELRSKGLARLSFRPSLPLNLRRFSDHEEWGSG